MPIMYICPDKSPRAFMDPRIQPEEPLLLYNDRPPTPPSSSHLLYCLPVDTSTMDNSTLSVTYQNQFQTRTASAIRRDSPPPRNDNNEIFCDHPDCRGKNVVFRRLCEWNKHMDRHERPYKCDHPNCQNTQGFTYSGGLMRHQREVHRWHQTTKSRLFCPFDDCLRNSSGEGFSRKENLEEHVRRRHGGRAPPSPYDQSSDAPSKKRKRSTTSHSQLETSPDLASEDLDADAEAEIAPDPGPPELEPSVPSPEGQETKRLRQELLQTREELSRAVNEIRSLRNQLTHYYTLAQGFPQQIYQVASPTSVRQQQLISSPQVHNPQQSQRQQQLLSSGANGMTGMPGYAVQSMGYKK
jgi:hypothetical protein